nr:D-alanyl-D-alanine carboxypeptidase family protein [Thermosediminibacter oceani]
MKKKILILLIVVFVLSISSFTFAVSSLHLGSSGVSIELDPASKADSNNRLVPIRFISDMVGGSLQWNSATDTSILTGKGFKLQAKNGANYVLINNTPVHAGAVRIKNGQMYVSLAVLNYVPSEYISVDSATGRITIGRKQNWGTERSLNAAKATFKYINKGNLILVNQSYPAGKGYSPTSLSKLDGKVPGNKSDLKLTAEAANQLVQMFKAAKKEGVPGLIVTSAYRPYSYQSTLFNNKVNTYRKLGKTMSDAKRLAGRVVAVPGTSEHQTGLAVDIFSRTLLQRTKGLEEVFDQTREGKWLIKNSYKYGFILRYPKDKQNITKIIYEPWHYRYVGKPHAEIITKKKMCLEEYIEYLKKNRRIEYTSETGETFRIYYLGNAGWLSDIDVFTTNGLAVDASSDNTGGLIVTVKIDKKPIMAKK